MSHPPPPVQTTGRARGAEMLLFLAVSVMGIYALGNALNGLFVPGKGIELGWLAVAGVAVFILVWQMGRVHDSWPRRRDVEKNLTPTNPEDALTDSMWARSAKEGDEVK